MFDQTKTYALLRKIFFLRKLNDFVLIFRVVLYLNVWQFLAYKSMQLKRVYEPFIHCTFKTVFTVGVNLLFSCVELGAPMQFITAKSAGLVFEIEF